MSSESRTEETKPVASGLDLRIRLMHRLADPARNATWAHLILIVVMLVGSVYHLFAALLRWEWQIFLLAGLYAVVMLISLAGLWLARRGRAKFAIWIVLISLQVAFAVSPLFVSGMGIWYTVLIVLATLSITSLCMQPKDAAVANLLGIVAGLAALAFDGFLTQLQTTPGELIEPFVITQAAIIVAFYLIILIAYFPTYSLRAKITITVFSAAILSIGALTIVNSISTRQALIEAVNQTLALAAQETTRDVDSYFQGLTERVANQAGTPTWSIYLALPPEQQASNTTTQPFLVTQRLLTGALNYALLDREGNLVLYTSEIETYLREPYLGLPGGVRGSLLQTMSSGAVYISPVLFPPTGETPYFLVAAQIRNYADQPVGILAASFPLEPVQALIQAGNGTAGAGSYAVLLDENNLRIAHGTDPDSQFKLLVPPTPRVYEEMVSSLRLPNTSFEAAATNYPDFDTGLANIGEDPFFASEDSFVPGEVNSATAVRLSSRPWVLVFMQSQSIILAPVAAQTRINILLAVIVSGLTILASALLARLVADPIVRLTSIAERAAGGNLYLQASTQSPDEIGTLGNAFNSMINQLRSILEGLESRIAERTAELTQTSEQMQYRANRLQMVTEVAHAIAAVQDPEELLPQVTTEISKRYGFYHVGVFLLDNEKMYAVLHASNSEGGQRMLARHHRLRIGQVGIVGYVAGTGEARIALDVGKDAVFFDNPDLPDTRSEIALPLKMGAEIMGVLDVQSTEPGAFSQDDIALLSALADQVATAIQNTRLYDEMRRTLRELQVIQQQYVQDAWSKLIAERSATGFEYTFGRIKPINAGDRAVEVPGIETLVAPFISNDGSGKLIVPVSLRGQVIGVLDLQEADPGREWSQEDLDMARAVADQVGLALENARLLAETQRRAERERLVADITTKMRAVNDPQAILETAAVELRNALRVKSVQVRLQNVNPQQGETAQPERSTGDGNPEPGGE